MEAGMVSTSLYPLAAAMKASPMPVLPDVGSTRVVCSSREMHHSTFLPKQTVMCLCCFVLKSDCAYSGETSDLGCGAIPKQLESMRVPWEICLTGSSMVSALLS